MKRRTKAILALMILVLPAVATARKLRVVGISTTWTGTYARDDPGQNLTGRCPATGCVGDLVSCGPTDSITITKKTFSFVARVCDDRDNSLPPCAGRFVALAEECMGPTDIAVLGPLITLHSRGEIRFCMDSGDCSGPREHSILGYGIVRTQTRLTAGSTESSALSSIVAKSTNDARFVFEGEGVRFFHGRRLVEFTTVEPNHGENCGGGCAVAGVTITDQT